MFEATWLGSQFLLFPTRYLAFMLITTSSSFAIISSQWDERVDGCTDEWLDRWMDWKTDVEQTVDCWTYGWMAISPNTHIQTCRRLMDIAISPHVMSAPNSLHTLRNGRLPTLGRREEGEREVILQILLLYYTNPYSCEWCQKEFVTKINLKKKEKKTSQTRLQTTILVPIIPAS